jgi:hypothetical protein
MILLKIKDQRKVEHYCVKNIGRRLYYLHNKIGGQGWSIKKQSTELLLTIDDDKKALMAVLILSDEIYEAQRR